MIEQVQAEAARLSARPIVSLFEQDPQRLDAFRFDAAGLTFDFSKQRLDRAGLATFLQLAQSCNLEGFRDRMAAGEAVNGTERRAALHVALRAPPGERFEAHGAPVSPEVEAGRARMAAFAADAVAGRLVGFDGRPVRAIVHIGIGGSDLGPRLVLDALKPYRRSGLEVRFAANIDGAEITDALAGLDPADTLVIAVSKTFTTLETMANADAARAWLRAALGEERANAHLAAVSAAPQRAHAWGVAEDRVFPFWDWVGGRYSVWSAVGLTCAIALEEGVFERFLAGAAAMDRHFLEAPLEANAPVLSAFVQTLNRVGFGAQSYALLPYARRLALLPAWAQQLEMESNGKRVTSGGEALTAPAAAVTWGGVGTDVQHSFFQFLHQNLELAPCEFIVALEGEGPARHHTQLLANAFAQAEALLAGKSADAAFAEMRAAGLAEEEARRLAPHRAFPGDRPSTLIALPRIDPESLGALLAYFEHRTVAQAALMGINPFDQWGVELGKAMAGAAAAELEGGAARPHDPSTAYWLSRARAR